MITRDELTIEGDALVGTQRQEARGNTEATSPAATGIAQSRVATGPARLVRYLATYRSDD